MGDDLIERLRWQETVTKYEDRQRSLFGEAADRIASLEQELEALRKENAELLEKVEAYRMVDHCVCRFEEDGETLKSECAVHEAIRAERDALREQVERTRQMLESAEAHDDSWAALTINEALRLLAPPSEPQE